MRRLDLFNKFLSDPYGEGLGLRGPFFWHGGLGIADSNFPFFQDCAVEISDGGLGEFSCWELAKRVSAGSALLVGRDASN